jgi:predicted transcriptional regulator
MNMSKSTLELLFDSKARVKILKFLFRNTGMGFSIRDLSKRVQERPTTVRREVKRLMEIGLLKSKNK